MNNDNIKSEVDGQPKISFWRKPKFLIPCASIIMILIVTGVCLWGNSIYEADKKLDAESVTLKEDRTMAFGETRKVSDFLENLNGTLVEDFEIIPEDLGETEISFDFINVKDKKRTIRFKVNVVDTVAPKIYGSNIYTVPVGYEGNLTDLILSGDDLDGHPRREITGNYNLDRVGRYNVEYVVTDAAGNQAKHPFVLNVVRPSNINTPQVTSERIDIEEIIDEHKTENTKIGIDVSQWQGKIDWQKVKDDGVEFAFIRVGYQAGFDEDYVFDPYFEANLQGATAVGLPVGVYFYSYADSTAEAEKQAKWIIGHIKDFPVELGVAFDWESWSEFNQAGMSFRKINQVAKSFLDTVKQSGYQGLLYSSKIYLERIWDVPEYETWLAQYYDRVTYEGDYRYWQLSNSGRVDGVDGDIDIDIMYLDEEA